MLQRESLAFAVFSVPCRTNSCLFCSPRLGPPLLSVTKLPCSTTPSPVLWCGSCSQAEQTCGFLRVHFPRWSHRGRISSGPESKSGTSRFDVLRNKFSRVVWEARGWPRWSWRLMKDSVLQYFFPGHSLCERKNGHSAPLFMTPNSWIHSV